MTALVALLVGLTVALLVTTLVDRPAPPQHVYLGLHDHTDEDAAILGFIDSISH